MHARSADVEKEKKLMIEIRETQRQRLCARDEQSWYRPSRIRVSAKYQLTRRVLGLHNIVYIGKRHPLRARVKQSTTIERHKQINSTPTQLSAFSIFYVAAEH